MAVFTSIKLLYLSSEGKKVKGMEDRAEQIVRTTENQSNRERKRKRNRERDIYKEKERKREKEKKHKARGRFHAYRKNK